MKIRSSRNMHIALPKSLAEPEVVPAQGGRSVKIAKKLQVGCKANNLQNSHPTGKRSLSHQPAGASEHIHVINIFSVVGHTWCLSHNLLHVVFLFKLPFKKGKIILTSQAVHNQPIGRI